jgi:glycosyltransferase involved in cell wall biosynthesis
VRIAFFTSRMLLGYGVDLVVAELAQRLARDGDEVTVFATAMDETFAGRGFELRKLEIPGAAWNRAFFIYEHNADRALARLRISPAIAQLNGYDVAVPCTFPFYGVHRHFPGPVVYFDFGNVPTIGFSLKGKLNWLYLHLMEANLHARKASAIVTISHFLARRFLPETQRRIRVVHLGGDHYFRAMQLSGNTQEDLRSQLRNSLGISGREVVIACCSRLHRRHAPYKNLPELLAVFKDLRADGVPVRLLLAGLGSPEDVAWLESQGADVLPNAPPELMPSFYSAADIYASPSLWEGFNLPLVEAAWFGVPAVAYALGAHSETTAPALVGSCEQFRAALERLVDNKHIRDELGESSRHQAQQFTWENSYRAFRQVLSEVAPAQ